MLAVQKISENTADGEPLDMAVLRDQVYRELMQRLPQPLDSQLALEVNSIIGALIDQITAQCQHDPRNADHIISTEVASAVSRMQKITTSARERSHEIRAKSQQEKEARRKARSERKQLTYDLQHEDALMSSHLRLSEDEVLAIDEAIYALFNEETPPENLRFVVIDNTRFWRFDLEAMNGQARYVMLPSHSLRMVEVALDMQGRYRITSLSAPILTPGSDRTDFREEQIVWTREQIEVALGRSFTDSRALSQLLAEQLWLDRLMQAYEEEAERAMEEARQALGGMMIERMDVTSLRGLPQDLRPTEMTDAQVLGMLDRLQQAPRLSA